MQDQFAERTHQEVRDDADEGVGEQQGRPVVVQSGGRAQEKPRADRATDRDHLDMAAAQCLFVTGLLGVEGMMWGFGLRHGLVLT